MTAATDRPPAGLEALRASIDADLDVRLTDLPLPEPLLEAVRYAALGPGKRLRPSLAILACEAVGGERSAAMQAAAAIELVHTFSLVHDDLPAMDDDELRRGRPTLHVHAGETLAILAGDVMMALAFAWSASADDALADHENRQASAGDALADHENRPTGADAPRAARSGQATGASAGPTGGPRLCAELAAATASMVAGQVYDTVGGFPPSWSDRERLEAVHRQKTGALLRAACRMGAICGGADAPTLERLTRFGEDLGLTFQIVDDVLDVTQPTEHLGKTAGKDERAGKLTFPAVMGLEASRAEIDRLTADAEAALEPLGPAAGPLRELARYLGRRSR